MSQLTEAVIFGGTFAIIGLLYAILKALELIAIELSRRNDQWP